jgi:RNA polymerase sigma-70 factor (ECF subfamily)
MPPVTSRRSSGAPLEHLSDDLLMVRMGRGEAAALRVLVFRHQGAAYRYCWRIFRDHHAAEDLAQELFVKIFRSAQRYQPQGHFTTYFYRVLANVCYDALRKRKRRKRIEAIQIDPVESEGTELEPLARLGDVDAPLQSAEAKDAVHDALGRLPVEVRKALELREFEGLRYREIASVLDLSLNEVKVLLHRGRKLLARALLSTPVGRDWSAPAREHDDEGDAA